MKQRIRDRHEIHSKDGSLEKHLARNTAQLRRVGRFLEIVTAWNHTLIQATETLIQGIENDAERERAGLKTQKNLGELRARFDSLTPREREVMALVVKGLLNKQAAAQLGTALITVKIQRASVMKKMKAESIADLVRMGEKLGILSNA